MSTPGCPTLDTAATVHHPVTAANKKPAENPGRFKDHADVPLDPTLPASPVGMLLLETGKPRFVCGSGTSKSSSVTRAMERGWLALSLWTRKPNEQAQRVYAKNGFRETGEVTRLPNGDGIGPWRLPVERRSR